MAAMKSRDLQDHDERYQALASYLAMKLSLETFGKIRSELDTQQNNKLQGLLDSSLKLHKAVLSAREAGVVQLPYDEVEAAYLELHQRFPTQKDFFATLAANQLDEQSIKHALQLELLSEAVLALAAQDVKGVSELEAFDYYQNNAAKFEQPERRLASHLLITINDDFPENTAVMAHQRIVEIAKEATAGNFAGLAERHSECPTAMHGGELGWVEKGVLHAELDERLFELNEGDIVGPIESEAGFHLLWCQSIKAAHKVSFEQAKKKIIEQHTQARRKRKQKEWLASLFD